MEGAKRRDSWVHWFFICRRKGNLQDGNKDYTSWDRVALKYSKFSQVFQKASFTLLQAGLYKSSYV